MTTITIQPDLHKQQLEYYDLDKVLQAIRQGSQKEQVEKVRSITDKKQRAEEKKKLPVILFSGKFEARKNDALVSHSGLAVIDFDGFTDLTPLKERLKDDKHVYCFFESPSGNGIKAVFKIEARSKEAHVKQYNALLHRYPDADLGTSDVARACFASYDPNIYINEKAVEFTEYSENKPGKEKPEPAKVQGAAHTDWNKLNVCAKMIAQAADGQKHEELIKASKLAGGYIAAGVVNEGDAEELLRREIGKRQPDDLQQAQRTIRDGIEYGKGQPLEDTKQEIKRDRSLEKIKKAAIDLSTPPEKPPIILSVTNPLQEGNNSRLLTYGNISSVIGLAKSKKTFFVSMLASTLLAGGIKFNRLEGHMESKPNVLYFDTEQGEYDAWQVANRISRLAKRQKGFMPYQLREFNHKERRDIIEYALQHSKDVGCLVIDGIADLVANINSEEEATEVQEYLLRLSKQYECHIMTVIHQNKGDNYATGHIGSAIMKKSEAIIRLQQDKYDAGISYALCDRIRGAKDFDPIGFEINSDGMPQSVEVKEFNTEEEEQPGF